MSYEVRIGGQSVGCYATQRDAVAHVREWLKRDAKQNPEIVDTETGKPVTPSAITAWREDLANKIAY